MVRSCATSAGNSGVAAAWNSPAQRAQARVRASLMRNVVVHIAALATPAVRRRYKECIKECNQGLAVEGTNERVLKCRAHARFESGLFKDALNDIQKVDAGADNSEEDAAFEAKVRAALSGKSSNGQAGGGSTGAQVTEANGASAAAAAKKPQALSKDQTGNVLKANATQFVCKVTLENETKYVHVQYGISYYELQQAIKAKWTGLHNFRILYHDKDHEWVTVTSQRDVSRAQQEILTYAQRMINQRSRQGLNEQVRPRPCTTLSIACQQAIGAIKRSTQCVWVIDFLLLAYAHCERCWPVPPGTHTAARDRRPQG